MTEFLLVRHGQTRANTIGIWQGWSDTPLNRIGHRQAKAVADRLAPESGRIEALYTSPLRRARETAHAIGVRLGLQPRVLEQLREIHFGDLEGTTLREMEDQFPELHARWQDRSDMAFQWPGGEQRSAFFARVAGACDVLHARHARGNIVVVAHGGTIRACLAHLLPDRLGEWWGYRLDNAGLSRVRVEERDVRLIVLNDTSHLG